MAGASLELPLQLFKDSFAPLGLDGDVVIESDLLGAFYSGTRHDEGYALIAGTGAVAARLAAGDSLAESARYASVAAALAATRKGTQTAYPDAAEVAAALRG